MTQTDHVAHVRECVFYGVKPLTGTQIVQMHASGLDTLKAAYSIACDLAAGFPFAESVAAYKRSVTHN